MLNLLTKLYSVYFINTNYLSFTSYGSTIIPMDDLDDLFYTHIGCPMKGEI